VDRGPDGRSPARSAASRSPRADRLVRDPARKDAISREPEAEAADNSARQGRKSGTSAISAMSRSSHRAARSGHQVVKAAMINASRASSGRSTWDDEVWLSAKHWRRPRRRAELRCVMLRASLNLSSFSSPISGCCSSSCCRSFSCSRSPCPDIRLAIPPYTPQPRASRDGWAGFWDKLSMLDFENFLPV
jgi:hypothetical protein